MTVHSLVAAFQAAPTPLLVVDADDRVSEANGALSSVCGLAAAELVGRALGGLAPPLDGLAAAAAAARATGAASAVPAVEGRAVGTALPLGEGRVLLSLGPSVGAPEPAGIHASEVLASISDAFFALDRDWRFTYVNEQTETLVGRSREDLLGKVLWNEYPDAVGTSFWDGYHEAVETGEPVQFDAFYEPLDTHFAVRAFPFEGGLSVYFTDITEAKRTEAALRTSEEWFRHLVLSLPAAVYTTDREGRVTLFNERAVDLWGRRPEIGEDRWCGSWRIFEPDGTPMPHDACPMAVALREGRAVRGQEIVVERPDGTRAHVLPHPEPLRDDSGAVVGAVNMLVDVTESREADRDRALLAAIVDSSDDAIVSKTLEGIITSWNAGAERILGYTAAEAVGQSILMLIPKERQDEETLIIGRIQRGERVDHFETVRQAKDGRQLDVSITVSPVRDGAGRIVGASKVLRDITEAKRGEAALREKTEALEAQTRALETVGRVNALLAGELDPERLVQAVTDAGTELTGAHFGAFFYNAIGEDGEKYMLYTISGVPREAFSEFPMPRNTAIFHPTFSGEGVVRLGDVLADDRYGKNDPYFGMPEGHLPVRSYLAVPVTSAEGEVVGGLFFGHPEPDIFDERTEQIAVGLAHQAAIGLQNARLYQELREELAERERAEAALRRSEENFRLFTETAVDVILTIDADSVIQYVNPAVEPIFGYRPEELVGTELTVLMPEGLRDLHRSSVARYLETGERRLPWTHVEVPGLRKDGTRIPLSISFGEYAANERHFFTGIIRDVTVQKEGEEALRQSEARARLALDAARLGLWSWDPATDEGTQDARTQELLLLAPDEQMAMTAMLERAVLPDDLPAVQAAVAAALDPSGDGRIEAEWRVPCPDGEPCWVRATAQMFFDGEGGERHPVQMIGTVADVTEQKESERQLLAVVDNLPEPAWSALPDGHIDFYNRRWYAYTGTTPEEMGGWGWEKVHDPGVLPRVKELWQHCLETGEPFEMEFPLRGVDGSFRWFITRATPLYGTDGQISRWIGVNSDIHDQKRAETQARYLAESGLLAEQALDYDATLVRLAELAVPGFSDWCSVNLVHDDGSIGAVAIAHSDPEKVRLGWKLQELRPPDPDAPVGAPNVIRTGQPELLPVITDELLVAVAKSEEELELLRGIGFSSAVTVPMRAGDDVIGAISFVNSDSSRHFDEMDLATAKEVGRRAGAALETARLYRALQRSEALAREAESRTRALFDATPDVVLVYPLGPDGPEPLSEVNEAAVETYGYTREELLQMRPTGLLVPGSISLSDAYARLRAEGTARFESVHRTRDGREIPMETVSHLVKRDGRETILSVCRDVTERQESERALRERERELHSLANSIPQMAWMADPSGAVFWYNRRWYDYTGMTPGDTAGLAWRDVLHPDEVDRVAAGFEGAVAAGEPWEDTFRIRSAGGYRWFLTRAVPLRDAAGLATRWFGTNTDVTEQRQLLAERDEAYDRLRQSQERHRLALRGGGMGTWEWHIGEDRLDGDERVYRLWGTRPDKVQSAAAFYAQIVHPDDLSDLQEAVARALEEGDDYTSEFRVIWPDGRIRWVANRGRVVRDASGAPVRMFGLSFDVTERRESEETLRRKNTEMEQFAYTISHDLKSPLVTITGFLGVLKGQVKAGETDRALAAADRVLGAADRMGRLIEDLLHLSRAGRVTGDPRPVDLGALAGGLADAFSRRVEEAGGTISVAPSLGHVLADEARLGEIVENLLANAVTYGLGGGGTRVAISSALVRGGALRLVVEDDGPGVPEAYREKVFELFQRLNGGGEGTGIGLALVGRIMEVMGGRAFVEGADGPPGREGARFVLEFPPSAVLHTPADESATVSSDESTSGGHDLPGPDAGARSAVAARDASPRLP